MRLSDQTAEKILSEEIDIYDILAGTETNILDGEDVVLQNLYDEIAAEHRWHPDDDFEQIIAIIFDTIYSEYA